MACVVEVQGFCNGKNFIPKEMCVLKGKDVHCFHIKCVKNISSVGEKERKMISWAANHYHGMSWDSGNFLIDEATQKVRDLIANEPCIYTKGREKALYLANTFNKKVIDLSLFGCPSIRKKEYKTNCPHHKTFNSHCAVDSAKYLFEFLSNGHFDVDGNFKKA